MSFSGVSVIMPVHLERANQHALGLLRRAALSVLGQECRLPVELVLIDDGSPKPLIEHPELTEIVTGKGVSHVRLPRNQGLVFALNAGLNLARYDLIARIDRDDLWRSGKLEKQIAAFLADPQLTILGTGMRLIHRGNSALDRDEVRGSSWHDVLAFFADTGCPFPHGSILALKDVFLLLGGYPHSPVFRHCEDFSLWGSWVRFFKAGMLEEVLFEYTVSPEQISSLHADQQRNASALVRKAFIDLGNQREIPGAVECIARHLRRRLVETSKILYVAWQYYDCVLTDPEILRPVQTLLPDRSVHCFADAPDLLAGRAFYIHDGRGYDRQTCRHLRLLHTAEDIEALVQNPPGFQ